MKAIVIGFVLGVIFSVGGIMGMKYCYWNPIEGSVIPDTFLCQTGGWIFYLPIIPQSFIALSNDRTALSFIIMSLVTIIEFILLSFVVSFIYKKFMKK
ncbi:hypothetical protein FJZ21_01330 [Candidatus Pacearchaeota archaeon]|nr:hypothetical protein [Candidatus Pacearchaeota archaeon]